LPVPEGFAAFEERLRQLGDKSALLIGLEASGHYWMSLWRFLLERDWAVEVFNPVLSSKSARTHLRGRKTDADDALFIARTVRDGDFISLQPAQEDTQQLKLLCRQRRFITHELTNAKRRLTGLIDLSFPEFSRHFDDIHGKAAHAVLKAAPNAAAIAGLSLRRLHGLIAGASRGRFGVTKAKALKKFGYRKPGRRAAGSCSGAADPLDDRSTGVLRTATGPTRSSHPEALLLHGSPD
jgi:transposase